MSCKFYLFWSGVLFFFQAALHADRLETRDGSTIFGKIIGTTDGNLSFETTYSSLINIPLAEIVSLSSPQIISIRDDNNVTFSVQSLSIPQSPLNAATKNQSFSMGFDKVQHIWTEESNDPLLIEEEKKELELLMKWKSSLGFDLVGSSGNTDAIGIGFRLDSTYSNNFRELDLFLSYNNQSTNGKTDTDETKGGAEYDTLFRDQLAWYLRSDFEHDPVEQINLRLTGASGLKYDWVENLDYQLSTRLGTAVRYEDSSLKTVGDNIDPAFDLGLEYSQTLMKSLFFESELTLLPKVDDFTDYLFNHDTALIFPILEENAWHIRSGLSGTFTSLPKEDAEKMDMKYYLRLTYLFE